jgi:hypothetical protein
MPESTLYPTQWLWIWHLFSSPTPISRTGRRILLASPCSRFISLHRYLFAALALGRRPFFCGRRPQSSGLFLCLPINLAASLLWWAHAWSKLVSCWKKQFMNYNFPKMLHLEGLYCKWNNPTSCPIIPFRQNPFYISTVQCTVQYAFKKIVKMGIFILRDALV